MSIYKWSKPKLISFTRMKAACSIYVSNEHCFSPFGIKTLLIVLLIGLGGCTAKPSDTISDSSVTSPSLKLPSIFQSGMVLQRNRNVPVWGWANSDVTITIQPSWQSKTYQTKANKQGAWMVKITTPDAGGPYTLIIQADTTVKLTNVLIGEVWLASGQSNMAMPVKGFPNAPVQHSKKIIANSKNNHIRLFTVERNTSMTLKKHFKGDWKPAGPASVTNFSAVGYIFGRKLEDALDIPIGIIESAWGGTSVKSWTDEKTLLSLGVNLNEYRGRKKEKHRPTVLFNAMIYPLIPFDIRGVIWYQGERDRGEPKLYAKVFPAMINSWRKKWKEGSFPFYFVQIAPFDYGNKVNSAYLRESQLKTMQKVPNTGMAVTLDIGAKHPIHPPYKEEVGNRLAYWALAKTYGLKKVDYSGPVYKSMKVKGNKAYLSFDHAPNGLTIKGDSLTHFTIAGSDKKFYAAKAHITNHNELVVRSDEVSHPVAVRYGWKNWLVGHLFDAQGLPAPSFRTDDW